MKLSIGPSGIMMMSRNEIESVVEAAMSILEKSGAIIENDRLLGKLAEAGARVSSAAGKVFFDRKFLVDYLEHLDKVPWMDKAVQFTAGVGIFQGYFLDPIDGQYHEWDEQNFHQYISLAKSLRGISSLYMLGCPIRETPVHLQPLYEKLYCWKYGIDGGEAIWNTEFCPKIHEMLNIYAADQQKTAAELFKGTIYLISPLKLGRVEAEQFMYFYNQGLRTNIGANGALGSGFPVTLAGGLAVHLAENLLISFINHVFFGTRTLHLGTSITATDMSSGSLQYGRPEKSIANMAMAQIARYLESSFSGHCGLSDAKTPSCEAGAQKVTSAIFTALAGGEGTISAGLLSSDEVFSPIQMIFDSEIVTSLEQIANGFLVDEETLALETILEEGPGGSFLATEHTAENFRNALWLPAIWSNNMFGMWDDRGRKNDLERAMDIYVTKNSSLHALEPHISEETEKRLMAVIHRSSTV